LPKKKVPLAPFGNKWGPKLVEKLKEERSEEEPPNLKFLDKVGNGIN